MMHRAEILLFFNGLARLLMEGQTCRAAKSFRPPLAIYFPNRVLVVKATDEIASHLAVYHRECINAGVHRISTVDPRIKDYTQDRALVTLNLHYLDINNSVISTSTVSYVLSRARVKGELRIELVDYAVTGFPGIVRNLFDSESSASRHR